MHLMALSDFTLASGLLCLQLPGGCYAGSPVEEKQSSDQQFRFQNIRFVGSSELSVGDRVLVGGCG